MTKTSKAILASYIMRNADKFPHPVLAVDVTGRYVYILTEWPKTASGHGEGECVCYRHNCENVDFSKAPQEDIKITLTVPRDDADLEEASSLLVH